MKQYRIKLTSWTASFRYPNIISGYQPTLEVPPVSTVLGLINAAAGKYLQHRHLRLGYYFDYEMKGVDLETIYQIAAHDKGYPKSEANSNVINREFLFNCRLYVYTDSQEIAGYLDHPYFPILLGRSGDLATVFRPQEVELTECRNSSNIKGQIVPFENNFLAGLIQPLPQYFTDTIPRKNIGTEAYSVIPYHARTSATHIIAYTDRIDDKDVDIYFHELNFEA